MKHLSTDCISKVKHSDPTAFRELFHAYKDPLFSYACKLCRSPEMAEEVVQEVFIKVWINRQHLDETLSIQAYLYTAVRHTLFNALKKAASDKNLKQEIFYQQAVAANITEDDVLTAELQRIKKSMLDRLPPQRKLIFCLSRIEGLSHEEIAQQLGISKNTVKDQIVKAVRFLKQELHAHHDIIIPMLVVGVLHTK